MPYAVESPSPVPRPTSLVVKNGSKMRSCTSRGMPTPLSSTISATRNGSPATASGSRISRLTAMYGRGPEPAGERSIDSVTASRAFTTRFISTWCNWLRSPTTAGSSGGVVSRISIRRSKVSEARETVSRASATRSTAARVGLPRRENWRS